jgi:hypothetical protein
MRAARRLLQSCGSWIARLIALRLRLRNRWSRATVLGDADAVVCLTSYGQRLKQAHLAIESVGRGQVRPRRLILWLDDAVDAHTLPRALRRLELRGLEIRGSHGNFGPHTKYFPYVSGISKPQLPLVTCDDDILYPKWWLRTLLEDYRSQQLPAVVAFRAHRIGLDGSALKPYGQWQPVQTDLPSHRNFVTGVSGAVYPPAMQRSLAALGDAFLQRCPRADDVWLNVIALRLGVKVKQVSARSLHFPLVHRSQQQALQQHNVQAGGNDAQLLATYDAADLAKLAAATETASQMIP